eukprot:gene30-3426_t
MDMIVLDLTSQNNRFLILIRHGITLLELNFADALQSTCIRLNAMHACFRLISRIERMALVQLQSRRLSTRQLIAPLGDLKRGAQHRIEICFHYHIGILLARTSHFVLHVYLKEILNFCKAKMTTSVYRIFVEESEPVLAPKAALDRATASLRRILSLLGLSTEELLAYYFVVNYSQLRRHRQSTHTNNLAVKKQTELPTPGKSNSSSYVHTSRQLLDTSAASVVSAGVASSTDSADNYLQDVMFSQNTVSPILGGRFSSMLVPMFYCNLVDVHSMLTAVVCGLQIYCLSRQQPTTSLELNYLSAGRVILVHCLHLALLELKKIRDIGVFFLNEQESVISGADLVTVICDHGEFDKLSVVPRSGPDQQHIVIVVCQSSLPQNATYKTLFDTFGVRLHPQTLEVERLKRDSPAHIAGMHKHDVITSINGR